MANFEEIESNVLANEPKSQQENENAEVSNDNYPQPNETTENLDLNSSSQELVSENDSNQEPENRTQEPISESHSIIETIEEPQPKYETRTNSWLFNFLWTFGIFFLLFFFFFGVYFKPIAVIGTSMQPTINMKVTSESDGINNDTALYRKKSHYDIGDIVIVSNEENQYIAESAKQDIDRIIKRVIARPGDIITFHYKSHEGSKYYYYVTVKDSNGVEINLNESLYTLEEMYFIKYSAFNSYFDIIAPNLVNENLPIEQRKTSIKISDGHYFIMGDNRNHSGDSRQFGQIAQKDILGSVRIIIKSGENIWTALLRQIKSSFVGFYNLQIKEYL